MPNSNLPVPLTRFIGREKEITAVMRLSVQTRLLTLTGSGGAGKTRLALEVAARLADSFEHGVAWVELAPLNDAALVPQAVAQVLGVLESTNQSLTQSLANYLRPQHTLLILDNCEHLITACAHLANEILQACPHLFILATSREALNIAGETAWRVPPLEIPNPKTTTTPEALLVAESARLFVDRAVSTESTFAVNRQNTNAIAQICYRLDGMPLAIELAAARIKSLPVEQIAVRLDDRFRLLNLGSRTAPPRQQTLRAVIDWSYGLLSPAEKILFRRLAVFAGGWTLDAAEVVCSSDGLTSSEILDSLARLVDKSLVITQNNVARYQMLETIRQYAREKLIEANELPLLQARHCDFFVQLGEEAEPKLKGPEAKEWMDRLETEYDNIRAVFEFAMTNEVASAVRLAWSLLMLWVRRGYLIEGRSVVLQMLARPELQGANRLRLQALKTIGYLQMYLLDSVAIRAYFEEGLTIAKMLKDENDLAFTLHGMGEAFFFLGDLPGARPWYEESLMLYRKTGNRWGEARSLFSLGNVMWELGDIQQGRALLDESLHVFHVIGDLLDSTWSLANLGALVRNQGDYTRAVLYYTQCIEILKRFNDRIRLAYALYGQAMSILGQGDYRRAGELFAEGLELIKRRASPILLLEWLLGTAGVIRGLDKPKPAAQLIGAADGLFESFRTQGIHSHSYYKLYNLISSEVRAELSAETFTHLWQEGHALDLDQAIEFALAEMKSVDVPVVQTTSVSPRQAAKEKFDGLTAREREVAALIAQGKSNREIAEMLVLSERTVEGHVGNILNKLNFNARTQIASWATQKRLGQRDGKP